MWSLGIKTRNPPTCCYPLKAASNLGRPLGGPWEPWEVIGKVLHTVLGERPRPRVYCVASNIARVAGLAFTFRGFRGRKKLPHRDRYIQV